MIEEMKKYPLANADLWKDKCAECKKIKIPVFVSVSYSNTLPTMGTFRAWWEISSEKKYLRIHDTQEWPDYYDEKKQKNVVNFLIIFWKIKKMNGKKLQKFVMLF